MNGPSDQIDDVLNGKKLTLDLSLQQKKNGEIYGLVINFDNDLLWGGQGVEQRDTSIYSNILFGQTANIKNV